MNIPSEIRAGDSVTWNDDPTTDNLGNVIDSSWTLKYALRQGAVVLNLTSTADAPGWTTTLTKASSTRFSAGVAYWQAFAEKTIDAVVNRVSIGAGQVMMLANIADDTSGEFDGRSQSQQDLDAVQAAMRAMIAGGAVAEYTIGGRQLRKIALADLIQLEGLLKGRVAKEKKADSIANGLGNPSNVFVRFK